MNDKINDILAGVGAMAECSSNFYTTLLKQGLSAETAEYLTGEFIKLFLTISGK